MSDSIPQPSIAPILNGTALAVFPVEGAFQKSIMESSDFCL